MEDTTKDDYAGCFMFLGGLACLTTMFLTMAFINGTWEKETCSLGLAEYVSDENGSCKWQFNPEVLAYANSLKVKNNKTTKTIKDETVSK